MDDDKLKTLGKIGGAVGLILFALSGFTILKVGALAGGVFLAEKAYNELKGKDNNE